MSAELAALAADPERVAHLEPEAIPAIVGELEALKARLWTRLQTPPAPTATPSNGTDPDRLLTAEEAGERLGVNKRWMYRHAETLPFTRKLSEGTLRFSSRGLEKWKERR